MSLRGAKRRGNPYSLTRTFRSSIRERERIAAPVCALVRNDSMVSFRECHYEPGRQGRQLFRAQVVYIRHAIGYRSVSIQRPPCVKGAAAQSARLGDCLSQQACICLFLRKTTPPPLWGTSPYTGEAFSLGIVTMLSLRTGLQSHSIFAMTFLDTMKRPPEDRRSFAVYKITPAGRPASPWPPDPEPSPGCGWSQARPQR